MQLPPTLQAWAEPLSVLDAELAIALGPLVRQLDQLITRQDVGSGTHGPLDGYDGITRQGDPTRLLISEWALADAVPDEFLRRAANAELLYLEPAYQQDRERAGVAVLVDTGPDQLGAARLVQLAALIVLLRRSAARGQELSLGILGDQPGTWLTGDPQILLDAWLKARRPTDPDPATVTTWTTPEPPAAAGDGFGEVWVLTGGRLARELPGRRRVLVTRECAWDEGGATAAEVRLAGDRVELALPRHDLAVRALRGAALTPPAATRSAPTGARLATFTGSPRRLLARGIDPNELIALAVNPNQDANPKRYHLPGPVLAAGCFSRRIVALVLFGHTLRVETIGKPLGRLDRLSVPLTALDLSQDDVEDLVQQGLPTLYFTAGAIVFQLRDTWWRLLPGESPEPYEAVAVATGHKTDEPRIAKRAGDDLIVSSPWARIKNTQLVIFGQQDHIARFDGDAWLLAQLHHAAQEQSNEQLVELPAGAEPFGVLPLAGEPTLLCYTAKDGTIQLCTATGHRTLTNLPRVQRTPSLHPFEPLLALELRDRIDVIDLATESLVATLRGDE